ncbi:hypothetical protein CDL12_08622 [Handroanthus impetiginosus]|uniref:Uncharacterized protein n=1 Tax=Handroanthus impetiginosus TaxID=429701 RepID=A0A2G9HMH3_9LAMI|nr:hypothetical protein CDL12_08622 [Handroanthus impetiginosus]
MSSESMAEVVLPLSSSNSYSLNTHVSYSCGSCGYSLNLNSCNRNTSFIDAKYASKNSWRLFQRRTKLLCRNCGNYIGSAWNTDDKTTSSSPFRVKKQSSANWDGISDRRTYEIRIRSLRPMSFEASNLLA